MLGWMPGNTTRMDGWMDWLDGRTRTFHGAVSMASGAEREEPTVETSTIETRTGNAGCGAVHSWGQGNEGRVGSKGNKHTKLPSKSVVTAGPIESPASDTKDTRRSPFDEVPVR